MALSITVLHILDQGPNAVEEALATVLAGEEYRRLLRLEGTFSAVRLRLEALADEAPYRYLICRPAGASAWTPVLVLGNHSSGLETNLSNLLNGCAVFTIFVYEEMMSGYRLTRQGVEVDRYSSDPSILRVDSPEQRSRLGTLPEEEEADYESERGHPERFADLLPIGTSAADFARVVLQPGWWQDYGRSMIYDHVPAGTPEAMDTEDEDLLEPVDEIDRMRCIALALELFGPSEYPFAQDLEDIQSRTAGPAIALAFS